MADVATSIHPAPGPERRRKMRKGTKSCTECRRRKIRCIYHPGISICTACVERGSQCIDQRDEDQAAAAEERVTLRERIARLESLLSNESPALPSVFSRKSEPLNMLRDATAEDTASDIELPANNLDRRAPFVSALDNADLLCHRDEPSAMKSLWDTSNVHGPIRCECRLHDVRQAVEGTHPPSLEKSKTVCETLRAALPGYDKIISAVSECNSAWWTAFNQKFTTRQPGDIESLTEFAMHAYTSNKPQELAMLVLAYARCIEQNYHLFALIERIVISDPAFSTTIDGLECLLLLGKVYTDIGQPRRSWFVYRRGVSIAQLMGLYRPNLSSPMGEKMWWALYHGDRFLSLLLGLPYACNDSHYGLCIDMITAERNQEHYLFRQQFTMGCSILAAKVIDRNMALGRPSLAKTMELDAQMDKLGVTMPKSWWDPPTTLPNPGKELDVFRERLLQQFYFFHIRTYLHLPFIVKSSIGSPSDHSRLTCMDASRQMLNRYYILRRGVQGSLIFDCRTTEFIAFMATVVLLIGQSSSGGNPSFRTSDEDLALLNSMKKELEFKKGKGCKMAATCLKTLSQLSGSQDDSDNQDHEPERVLIPYFGNVMLRRPEGPAAQTQIPLSPIESNDLSASTPMQRVMTSPTIVDGMSQADVQNYEDWNAFSPGTLLGATHWEVDGFGNFTVDNISSWIDLALVGDASIAMDPCDDFFEV